MTENATPRLARLLEIMTRLRDPERGCPWDREQSFATIAPYTIEEAYEVADAIERNDMADLRDELGDLLFQVVFHARMAEEAGAFAFEDVAGAIADKMERRHPHVFANAAVRDAYAQTQAWEQHKDEERRARAADGVLAGVPLALPALVRAEKLGKRAARVGFDWSNPDDVADKVVEELAELDQARDQGRDRIEHEIGDLLFAVAQLSRHLKINPETALKKANNRFESRFGFIETTLAATGRSVSECSMDELEKLWIDAKGLEGNILIKS